MKERSTGRNEMGGEEKMLSHDALRDSGILMEVNRQFFHPIGLALAIVIPEPDESTVRKDVQLVIMDYTDDPEGLIFDKFTVDDLEKFHQFHAMRLRCHDARIGALGYITQPFVITQASTDAPSEVTETGD